MTDQDIIDEIVRLSGSGKRVAPGARRHGIYSSFTIPPYDKLEAVRDTEQRFKDFGLVAEDGAEISWPHSPTFLDVGSNVGAVSFRACQLGAMVTGVEYREDRVNLCNVIAQRHHYDAKFHQVDLNNLLSSMKFLSSGPSPFLADSSLSWMAVRYDYVWCSSVDEYIDDVDGFYRLLRELCSGTLLFECNRQGGVSVEETEIRLRRAGFARVKFVGNGHSGGIARKRKLFVAEVK